MAGARKQIRPQLPEFPSWVMGELVGIVENDPTAVTRWVVVEWIKDNEEWLGARGITYERYYNEVKGGGPMGTVSPMKPRPKKKPPADEGEDIENGDNGTNGA